ncbi:MAG: ATP-binding domain-containing protein, partial [Pseudohongiella sp.]|nr:ATP-binding domain-containing protein [Pseudohongiella sp.]
NGDIGITLPYPNPASPTGLSLRVAFRDTADAGHIRWILPTRLQQLETVFAMTVHKSQGSEFAHTAMVLPTHDSPILTRELIYTGVTRASKQFTLICSKTSVLEKSVQTRVFRAGGLEL